MSEPEIQNKAESQPTPESPKVTVIEEDIDVHDTKDYGIGIDCHKLFIMVCVRTKMDGVFIATTARFATDWDSLLRARDWCVEILKSKSSPPIDTSKPLHYVIESTATYHHPVRIAWGGVPSIINPTLAGVAKRKTDRLDAKLLALHDQTSIWRESFIVPAEVEALRLMIAERDRYVSEARAASNRINNAITRFGLNLGRDGSVTKDKDVRALVENQASDHPDDLPGICPVRLPMDARLVIREEYQKYDYLVSRAGDWKFQIVQKAYSMNWETSTGTSVPGEEIIPLLMTAPQIGELTAIIWLANIVTPSRFANSRAIAAYCGLDPSLKVSANHVTSTKKRGGCKQLHKMLCSCADRLIRTHTEMLGQWGCRLYSQTGKWKKASNAHSGLILFGTVVDRVRRMVPKNNPVTEIVTYTIQDTQNRKHFVDDYAPDSYHDLGENVELPVYIKPYVRKNGEASYTLNIQKADSSRGDHF